MKWIKYGLVALILVFFVFSMLKFIKGNPNRDEISLNIQPSTPPVSEKVNESGKDNKVLTKDETWDKIANSYIEDETINEPDENVLQDDWVYHINSASITKKYSKKWDAVPDYSIYQYDKNYNLINNYSYVVLNITVQCKQVSDSINDFWLNALWLNIYDSNGNAIKSDYSEMATASLGKPRIQSYFHNPLKKGESLTTDIVYIVADDILKKKDSYYVLSINNQNIKPSDPEDIGLIKIPLGVEK